MFRKTTLWAAILATLTTGCGRGDYDKKVEDTVRRYKNPPAENNAGEAGKGGDAKDGAAKDGEAKDNAGKAEDAPKADAPKAEGTN